MDELITLQETMFAVFGEEFVRELAEREDFSVDVVPDMLDDETVLDMFAEMVRFILESLAPINPEKAKTALLAAGITEETIDELLEDA